MRVLSREVVTNDWRDENWSHTSCWPCHDPIFITPSWFTAPLGLAADGVSTRPWATAVRKTSWTKTRTSSATTGRPGAGCSAHFCATIWRGRFGMRNYVRVRDMHGLEELVNHGLNELGLVCIQYLRTCFASGCLGPGQAGTLISGLRGHMLLARSCGADLEDHQSVFRTLWRVHRMVPRHPSWVQNTSVSRDRVECGNVCLASQCPRTFLFNTPFVSLFVSSGGSQATSMVRRENCWWIPLNTLRKVYDIMHIRELKTRRVAGRAAQKTKKEKRKEERG